MTSRLKDATLIYECFVEVSKPTATEEAQIRYVYPKDFEWEEDTKKQLPKFTFPTRTSNVSEEHFTFVLTDLDGKYRFGFCRYPPKGESCLCFLSDLPWYKVFYRAMDKISDLRLDHQHEVVEPFLAGLRAHPIPSLGLDTVLSVVPKGVDTGQVYTFPLPNPKRLPEIPTDDNLTQFYTNLHYNVILHLFANLIFERRIIITSSSLSLLSATVHGVVTLLYPLHWQHIFIPITPPHLLDYCAAPMPFLMGIHSSYMDLVRRMPIEDVVLLDVDESAMESPHVEDLLALPPEVISDLKHVLKKQSSGYGDTVSRSFLRAQVSMIGGYRSALKFRQGEKEVVFDEDQFLKSRPNSEEFLEKLLHFQHFRQFMNFKIDKLKNRSLERDRFDDEVMMYEEGAEKYKVSWEKLYNSTVKFSDKLKEGGEKFGGRMRKQAKIVLKKLDPKYNTYYQHGQPLPHGKTHSLPMHKSASESLIHHRPTIMTPPPVDYTHQHKALPRKPPPVIPYHRHKEGKQKLADILRLQGTASSSADSAVGNLVTFTPPGTPRSSVASGDQSERVSLDSRGSTDISVHSGEANTTGDVVVGDLIDITSSSSAPVIIRADSSSESDSIVSSSSSSAVSDETDQQTSKPKQDWETFDDIENQQPELFGERPPLPPPRSELQILCNSHPKDTLRNESATPVDLPIDSPPVSSNPFIEFDYDVETGDQVESELTFNLVETSLDSREGVRSPIAMEAGDAAGMRPSSPFESLHLAARPQSPFDDFSSSIAQVLKNNSERLTSNDPLAANALANASQDLAKTDEDDDDDHLILANASALEPGNDSPEPTTLPVPMTPTTTSGNSTADVLTELPRSPAHINLRTNNTNAPHVHTSASSPSLLRPSNSVHNNHPGTSTNPFYNSGYQNSTYNSKHLQRPSGPRSPKFAQEIPLSFPQVALNPRGWVSKRPPPRPQPYSGEQLPQYRQQFQTRTQSESSADPALQRLPSIGSFNPFGDLLGSGGMEAYVGQSPNNKESPLV